MFSFRQEIDLRGWRFKSGIPVARHLVASSLLVLILCGLPEANAMSKNSFPAEVAATQAASNPAHKISFLTVAKGSRSGIREPLQAVVRNETEWRELWQKHVSNQTNPPPPPSIDFTKEIVAAVFLGEKPTGGYEIQIVSADRSVGSLTLSFDEKHPPPGGMTIQAFTQPFHIVRVAATDTETVVFRRLP